MPSLDIERRRAAVRKWDAAHKVEKAEYQRARRKAHPEIGRIANWRKWGLKLTMDEYNLRYREQMGACAICHRELPVLCVDHNHKTKVIRGLLCPACNKGLGCFRDKQELLESALSYLEESDGIS